MTASDLHWSLGRPPLQIQATEPDKEAKVQGHDSPRE